MPHKFLVHAPGDSVGVAIESITTGEDVEGVVLENDSIVRLKALDDIPLGHKVALAAIATGSDVAKYGVRIGRAIAAITAGQHVHTHNLKSARW
jgi:(2R)-sulfolactate sulfo-lyase subunit alpha